MPDIFSEQFDQYTPPPSAPPQAATQYLLAPRAMENAMLRAMGEGPSKPVVKKKIRASGGQTIGSYERHARIREAIVAAVEGKWLSIDQIAKAISEERDVVKNKTGVMVASGLLTGRGHCRSRLFTKGKGPKKKKTTRRTMVSDRREAIVKAINRPMKLREIVMVTGTDRHALQGDLNWLSNAGRIEISKEKNGLPATYGPVEV